jgi:L-alanine-DL-glutamate epimerase-like enolase superfamily enzyme/multimeric flavodoxin WrbA
MYGNSPAADKPKILGISASLRNARCGVGSDLLVEQIRGLGTRDQLQEFLSSQAKICLEQFVACGRKEGLPFDQIYSNYEKLKGDRGLSNSEIALASALWGAKIVGCDIEHVGLSDHFKPNSESKDLDELAAKLLSSDGILISGPVYFGDRGSLAHELIEFLRSDRRFRDWARRTYYAGIAVGAKRNGGQETTLIYQMLDLVNLGFLAVGNDSETTAQYGGTGHAGDVGTMADDKYGIETSIGTGRRIARVALMSHEYGRFFLKDRLQLGVWILQDADQYLQDYVEQIRSQISEEADVRIINFSSGDIARCIACDICPTHVDIDQEYRCIIKRASDQVRCAHSQLIGLDALLVASYSPVDRSRLASNYQKFIERTRYLRRGDYVLTDTLVAPLILDEIGANENLHIRTMTSMIRHHTIMFKPIVGCVFRGEVINQSDVRDQVASFVETACRIAPARLASISANSASPSHYNPVGYIQRLTLALQPGRVRPERGQGQGRREHLPAEEDGQRARPSFPTCRDGAATRSREGVRSRSVCAATRFVGETGSCAANVVCRRSTLEMHSAKISSIEWAECRFPIKAPYQLSLGTVPDFHSLICWMRTTSGRVSMGESTPLQGYTNVTMQDVSSTCAQLSRRLLGLSLTRAAEELGVATDGMDGFSYTAVAQCLELLSLNTPNKPLAGIPILAGLEMQGADIGERLDALLRDGFREIKVKVGRDVEEDVRNVRKVAAMASPGVLFRIDANQGYSVDQCLSFIEGTRFLRNIRLLEQPLRVGQWQAMAEIRPQCPYALMLDEDIRNEDDIWKASRFGACDYVKLKLMKCGGFRATVRMIKTAERCGLKVVLGNGVQTEIGCWNELLLYAEHLGPELAGEMNGFTRQQDATRTGSMRVANGLVSAPAWSVWVSQHGPQDLGPWTINQGKFET